jgi:16S rRNA (cytidine1402-2'-O)-methyltransferase
MWTQNSYEESEKGKLFVVPTPIGNLQDITLRGLETLKTADKILAEDTRNTKKLLNHFEITTPLLSYHEHSDQKKIDQILAALESGTTFALVSDAGMPGISDPGEVLIKQAIDREIDCIVLPGANAALVALVGSGLPTKQFYFYGFLPRKNKEIKQAFEEINKQTATILLYESPYRLTDTLQAIKAHLGNRQVAVGRELTKRFEEFSRGMIDDVINWSTSKEIKGECCIVIEGRTDALSDDNWWEDVSIKEHVDHYINEGQKSKDAIKQVAIDRKQPKRDIYQVYHIEESE